MLRYNPRQCSCRIYILYNILYNINLVTHQLPTFIRLFNMFPVHFFILQIHLREKTPLSAGNHITSTVNKGMTICGNLRDVQCVSFLNHLVRLIIDSFY